MVARKHVHASLSKLSFDDILLCSSVRTVQRVKDMVVQTTCQPIVLHFHSFNTERFRRLVLGVHKMMVIYSIDRKSVV